LGKELLPFHKAREFVRALGLKSRAEWIEYHKSGKKPGDIPSNPAREYKKEWKGWGDWLGTGNIGPMDREYRRFELARQYVHSLKLKRKTDWEKYLTSNKLPKDIPTDPRSVYKGKGWKGFGDWLGTGNIAPQDMEYRSFEEARKYVHTLELGNRDEWNAYCKSNKKPEDIPASPAKTYKSEWKGWGDWLGTGRIAPQDRKYRTFELAQQYVHSLGIKSKTAWGKYCRSKKLPNDIPTHPDREYAEKGWKGWGDWLGTGRISDRITGWNITKIKALLKGLLESDYLRIWPKMRLYGFLLTSGLQNLSDSNRHSQFFKNIVNASRTEEGIKVIEEYANSDSDVVPDLLSIGQGEGEEVEEVQSEELAGLLDETSPLDYGNIRPFNQILDSTNKIESINVDEESAQFFISETVKDLWKSAFRDENIKAEVKNGNKFHDTVLETFMSEYMGAINLKIPEGYAFSKQKRDVNLRNTITPPRLMQLHTANQIKNRQHFCNFSGTGSGKTLSAILASRVVDSKMTVIVCPYDIVQQWKENIQETYPDSKVLTRKEEISHVRYHESKYQYLVLNYDKFSQEDSPNLIINLVKQKIDFLIFDEIHFAKIRNDEDASKRSELLLGLRTEAGKRNKNLKILGMTATPVINNIDEGISMLQLVTGKKYEDLPTRITVPNAYALYKQLCLNSIREMPVYTFKIEEASDIPEVYADLPEDITLNPHKNPLIIEQLLTDARLPEIIRRIVGQTLIYTKYVTGIVHKLVSALEAAGYKVAQYTGSDHSGQERFKSKQVQVLVASQPISVGVDGIQDNCNNLIINTPPWTNSEYQQVVGRLYRLGQTKDIVHVHSIMANLKKGEHILSWDKMKWDRIKYKKTLADCAVDGVVPEKNLITVEKAEEHLIEWIRRVSQEEIYTVIREELNVKLNPVEIKKRLIKYGDFTKQNTLINTENSDTTHKRIQKDPTVFFEYHRNLNEIRKPWGDFDPCKQIIERIKKFNENWQIADFGCGEAKVMETFGHNRVHSFDHYAINEKVTACDMKNVPIKEGKLDVIVLSLSLMGKNWRDYIAEAKRCLCTRGSMLIAETTRSLTNGGRLAKLREVIKESGFVIDLDEERGEMDNDGRKMFTFLEATKL